MTIYKGNNVNIDYSDLALTAELQEALQSLDHSCLHGCGGTWEIYEEAPDEGTPYRAVFTDMACDELLWNSAARTWNDGNEIDEDEDEDEEDDDGGAFEEARHMAGMSGGNQGLADFYGLEIDPQFEDS